MPEAARAADRARSVYHISPLRTWLPTGALAGLCIALAAAAGASEDPAEQRALAITAVALCGFTALMYRMLRFTRFELSQSGVRLYQIGYTLETGWDNVAALYDVRGAQGLVLHRPMEDRGASVLSAFRNTGAGAGMRLYGPEQVRLLAERRFIPIEPFAHSLKHGRLREELRRYAPSIGA